MIQINSELPNCLLKENENLNDYDFVLYHLLIKDKQYRDYYMDLRKSNPFRKMILDNSAYEFFINGEVLDINDYLKSVWILKPDYFILPDSLMDYNKTIEMIGEVILLLNNDNIYRNILNFSRPIAVAQGSTERELLKCIKDYSKMGIENICIPFHNKFFSDLGFKAEYDTFNYGNVYIKDIKASYKENFHKDIYYAIGRIVFIYKNRQFLEDNFKYIHMLGSHCPLEKYAYKSISNIKSMDTGYPVKCAIAGYELLKEPHKPDIIIDNFLNDELSSEQKGLIIKNIKIFKNI